MAQALLISTTTKVGVTLRKEEVSYFQFVSSDVIVLFGASSNMKPASQVGNHHRVDSKISETYPVLLFAEYLVYSIYFEQ